MSNNGPGDSDDYAARVAAANALLDSHAEDAGLAQAPADVNALLTTVEGAGSEEEQSAEDAEEERESNEELERDLSQEVEEADLSGDAEYEDSEDGEGEETDDGNGGQTSTNSGVQTGGAAGGSTSTAAPPPAPRAGRVRSSYPDTAGQAASINTTTQTWTYQQPVQAPFGFQIPTSNTGGVATRIYVGPLDFTNRHSVHKANDYVGQVRTRAREKLSIRSGRSTRGRRFTQAHKDWLDNEYRTYAAANNGVRIRNPLLTQRFNAHFHEATPCSDLSIGGIVRRTPVLEALKQSYREQ